MSNTEETVLDLSTQNEQDNKDSAKIKGNLFERFKKLFSSVTEIEGMAYFCRKLF